MSKRETRPPAPIPGLEPERYELFEAGLPALVLDRRAFLRSIGGGLLVLCLLRRGRAQESGRSGRREGGSEDEIGAWLHIGEDGAIAAFTGKVEVGQNARTSLSQAVADELHVPIDDVRMVMGDTDRVPFDRGTFGSLTTPTMVPQLRRAAAAARALLIGLAAERWGVDAETLKVDGGSVSHPISGRSIAYGTLTSGRDLVETIVDDGSTPPDRWRVAGRSAPKVDGLAFVTGRHRYTSDMSRPGMMIGKVLRPPRFGATLESLGAADAEAIPEVVVVRDGDFVGVAAPDLPSAETALKALRPEWSEPSDIASPDHQSVYDYFDDEPGDVQRRDEPSDREVGSITRGLKEADSIIEGRYTVAYIAHAPLEPRSAIAEWEGDRLTVWTGTQRPFGVREELVRAFEIPEARVRVLVPDTGSGYGGKHTGEVAIEAARLARAAGRPVRLVWTREEEFTWSYFRPAGLINARAGVRSDGTLTAWEFTNINSGGSGIETPYEVPNRRISNRSARSPLRQGSYRALASTANHFARESLMDELAQAVGIGPLAFRLLNLRNDRLRAVLTAAAERFEWDDDRASEDGRGFGLACGTEKGGHIACCVEVAVDPGRASLRVLRIVAAFECGAIVNPDQLRNQVEGATIMGLGGALFEAIAFEGGRILNPRFADYRVPRFSDIPDLDVVLIDRPDLPAAGAGESPIVAIAPAIGNALRDATGRRSRSLPLRIEPTNKVS